MKKFIILIICLFIANINGVFANDCEQLKPTLKQFYNASKEENLENYMEIIDIDYVKENILDNYEDYVKSAWKVYDVSNFEITTYNCKIEGDDAIYYFNLKSTLVGEETIEVQRNYVGVFHKLDTWKIRYVMDEEIFDQYQSISYSNIFLESTQDIIDEQINDAQELIDEANQGTGDQGIEKSYTTINTDIAKDTDQGESPDTSVSTKNTIINNKTNTGKNNNISRLIIIIILSAILFILYKFITGKDFAKIKSLSNKEKTNFILKQSFTYLKQYLHIVWKILKKLFKIIMIILTTIYNKSKPIIINLKNKIFKKKTK